MAVLFEQLFDNSHYLWFAT